MATTIPPLIEVRCPACKALLFKARLAPGTWVQTKCSKCNELVTRERKAA